MARGKNSVKLNSLYVGVTDMKRAVTFYKSLFQTEPVQLEERYSMFEVGGMYFGLFFAQYDDETLKFGNNCVPNLEVESIEAEHERITRLTGHIDPEIREVNGYRYFQFKDSDGNTLEVYSKAS